MALAECMDGLQLLRRRAFEGYGSWLMRAAAHVLKGLMLKGLVRMLKGLLLMLKGLLLMLKGLVLMLKGLVLMLKGLGWCYSRRC